MNIRKDARRYAREGQFEIDEKNSKAAVVIFSRAIRLKKNRTQYFFGMAEALAEQRKYKQARAFYKRVVIMDPNDAAACYNLAYVLDMLSKTDESIEMYKEAIRLDPADVSGYKKIAILLNMKGRSEEAREYYLKILEIQPLHADEVSRVRNGLGCGYFIEGAFAKAAEEFQKSIILDKKFTHAHCNMGLILFCEGKNEEALKFFEDGMKTFEGKENKIEIIKDMIESYTGHKIRIGKELESMEIKDEEKMKLSEAMIGGLTRIVDLLTQEIGK